MADGPTAVAARCWGAPGVAVDDDVVALTMDDQGPKPLAYTALTR